MVDLPHFRDFAGVGSTGICGIVDLPSLSVLKGQFSPGKGQGQRTNVRPLHFNVISGNTTKQVFLSSLFVQHC